MQVFLAGTFLPNKFKNFEFINNVGFRIKYKNYAITYVKDLFNYYEVFEEIRSNYSKLTDIKSND